MSAAASNPEGSQAQRSGVRVSLRTAQDTYPRDALVRVSLTIENAANASVLVQEFRFWHPHVVVRDHDGAIVYFSTLSLFHPPSVGPRPWRHVPLSPGDRVEREVFVVVSGENRQGYVDLMEPRVRIPSNVATVQLTEPAPPRVSVTPDPALRAEIEPTHIVEGPLYYLAM